MNGTNSLWEAPSCRYPDSPVMCSESSSTTESEGGELRIRSDDPVGPVAQRLIGELCAEMSERYGSPPSPFSLSEAQAVRSRFLVAWRSGEAMGCGGLRELDAHTAEIKRMYVVGVGRRQGIARRILAELEFHARAFNFRVLRLETGVRQPEAQRLYQSLGYLPIDAFGPYFGNPTSVCFEKILY